MIILHAYINNSCYIYFRWYRVRCDGGWCVVLYVPAGQLESGVPDDRGPLQTQQPGIWRQTVHHRRTGCIGEPGPRGEVRVTQSQQQAVHKQQTPPAAPSWWMRSSLQPLPQFDSHLQARVDDSAKVGGCWAIQFEKINIHTAQRNVADGVACSSAASILQKWLDRFVSIFCESKRCREMNLSRSILNGHSCECCGATECLLLVCEWCFYRAEWYTVSDSIYFSIDTSPILHLKVVHYGLFSWVFSSSFFLYSSVEILT